MDPLIIGFEDALHEANAAPPTDGGAVASLVAKLRAVIDASPHRARRVVSVSALDAHRIELRRGDETYVLDRQAGRWRLLGHREPSLSGPVAAALAAWLIA